MTALRLRAEFLADGRTFAHAAGGARILGARRYAVLRARSAPEAPGPGRHPRPHPADLGLESRADVLISRRDDDIVVDPADRRHPYYFDHGTDHVPGMAVLEAARQAIALRSGGLLLRPVSGRMTALKFTEHTPAAVIECSSCGRSGFFRIRQGGECTAEGELHYR